MKPQSLKFRFTATVVVVYIAIGVVTYGAFRIVTGNLVRSQEVRMKEVCPPSNINPASEAS